MIDYTGVGITIEEMPQGCFISDDRGKTVWVWDNEDAEAIIKSLKKMLKIQFEYDEEKLISL